MTEIWLGKSYNVVKNNSRGQMTVAEWLIVLS